MKFEELETLIKSGVHPVIEFTAECGDLESYAKPGMRARVTSITHESDCARVGLDYTEFDDFNKSFETSTYYSPTGDPCLTAREAGFYSKQDSVYVDPTLDFPAKPSASGPALLHAKFLASGWTGTYVSWLESRCLDLL